MTTSILNDVKKVLGISEAYTAFDTDILMHINTAISTLTQIGVGPDTGFFVADDTDTWSSLLGDDPRLNSAKTYVYLKVKMVFDPPSTSYLQEALQRQIEEIEWRLNVTREEDIWYDSSLVEDEETSGFDIIDGGVV